MKSKYRPGLRPREPRSKWRDARFLLPALLAIVIFAAGFLLIGASEQAKELPATKTPPPSLEDADLAWPADAAAAVGTVEHGVLASSKNESPRPIASMAKVILALAIMEKQPFGQGETGKTYIFTEQDVKNLNSQIADNGSVLPVLIGQELTEYQALQRILIASDNNVADKMTRDIFGSEEAYLSYANKMLKKMGLSQTTVADPSGLSPQTLSTPSEMVELGIAAMKNPSLAEIVAMPTAELPGIPGSVITNTNKLLGADGVVGVKTGTTDEAGYCLLFAARHLDKNHQEMTIVGVVMGSKSADGRFADSRELLLSVKEALCFGSGKVESVQPTKETLQLKLPGLTREGR